MDIDIEDWYTLWNELHLILAVRFSQTCGSRLPKVTAVIFETIYPTPRIECSTFIELDVFFDIL